MTTLFYSTEWRDLALAWCAARDAAVDPPSTGTPEPAPATGLHVVTPGGAGLPDDQFPNNPVVGHAPGPSVTSPGDSGPGASPEDLSLPRLNGAPQ